MQWISRGEHQQSTPVRPIDKHESERRLALGLPTLERQPFHHRAEGMAQIGGRRELPAFDQLPLQPPLDEESRLRRWVKACVGVVAHAQTVSRPRCAYPVRKISHSSAGTAALYRIGG
jgi:hypothetical protein